ncbi:MT-A70 family methyltransferase [Gryllotalpicola reticulitermitis]|uniref:MT-A70 family methyltransferase n=1 Tax=Gryllotalpicola reticulitermitis TaxID=1184153 RepID=A0ABV8QCU7_9MICO
MSIPMPQSRRPTPKHKYRVIYADPPWPTGQKGGRGASRHYDLMSLRDIEGMGTAIKHVAAVNSALFLWTTSNDLPNAFKVMEAWGYRYITTFIWDKRPVMALGAYFRGAHEVMLFGVHGKVPFNFHGQRSIETFKRREHSRKPDEIFPLIERLLPGPALEVFGRRFPMNEDGVTRRPGWSVWGNEVASDISLLPFGYPVPSDFDEQEP